MGMSEKNNSCYFSGLKINPGRGILFVRNDGQCFNFSNSKNRRLYNCRKRPAKIAWTAAYRKLHKKDRICEILKRKKSSNVKSTLRSYASASMELIMQKCHEKQFKISTSDNL